MIQVCMAEERGVYLIKKATGLPMFISNVEGSPCWVCGTYSDMCVSGFPLTSEQELLSNLLSELKNQNPTEAKKLQTFLTSELGAPLPLHISLSRPIVFTTENKGEFLESLQTAIKSSKIQPFDIAISDLSWCENFEKTRWFLVLKVKTNSAE